LKRQIYLDYAATTPLAEEVLEAMLPFLKDQFGNPASISHDYGRHAAKAVQDGRAQIAQLINADPKEIIFTSGATESDNLAIKGVAQKYRDRGNHIITCGIEHKAILDTCKYLEQCGCDVTYLPVDNQGVIDLEQLSATITDKTILITIMAANNEIGVLQPISEIGALARERNIFFHCDGAQAVGKIPVDVQAMNIDLLSISAHKIYGPKGVGALYVRDKNPRVRPSAQMHGGGHELGMRSGTLNTAGIVGLAAACSLCQNIMSAEASRLGELTEKLYRLIVDKVDLVKRNGHPEKRLAHLLNLSFAYVEGESLMLAMPDIAVSSGSACTSATLEPSYVLKALDVPDEWAHGSLRFSLGRYTTEQDITHAADGVVNAVNKMRAMSPLYEMALKNQEHAHGIQ
jgi:cysteine desulfurase